MYKKGFQLSLNVIVVAILALIVLVSSTIFFANKFGMTSGELSKCASYNGECVGSSDDCDGRELDASCEGEDGGVCCVTASSLAGGKDEKQDKNSEDQG